jgi:competence protein ComEC
MPWGLLAMLLMPLGLERFALIPMGWGVEGLNAIARYVGNWPDAATLVPSMPGAACG